MRLLCFLVTNFNKHAYQLVLTVQEIKLTFKVAFVVTSYWWRSKTETGRESTSTEVEFSFLPDPGKIQRH